MCFEDVESLLWYKHVVKTLFERPKEAFAWVTIAQDSVCCSRIFAKPVVMRFDQRQGSSDGEVILPKAAGCRLGLTEAVAACPVDRRQAGKVEHETGELLAQRLLDIQCGYPDANDAACAAEDPVQKCWWDAIRSRVRAWPRRRCCRNSRMSPTANSFTGWRRWPTASSSGTDGVCTDGRGAS